MDYKEKILLANPRESTNPISKLLFWWILPLFRKGYNKQLEVEDMYDVLKEDTAGPLCARLSRAWDDELQNGKKNKRRPKFYRAVFSVFGFNFAMSGLVMGLHECIFRVIQALCLKWLVELYTVEHQNVDNLELMQYLYAGGICVMMFLGTLAVHPSVFWSAHIGMQIRIASSSLMYRKTLRLSKSGEHQSSVGQLVNLLSNDVNRFDNNAFTLHFFIIGPIQTVIFTYILWEEFGIASMAGTGLIIILIPLQYFVGKYLAVYRMGIAERTDTRVQILNEIIMAMRIIKIYAWEKPFTELIEKLRKLEMKVLRKSSYLRGFFYSLNISSAKLITFLTFLAYIFMNDKNTLTANKVFFAVTIYNIMRQSMVSFLPAAAAALGELIVAMNRIENFLLMDEQKVTNNLRLCSIEQREAKRPEITLKRVCARWSDDRLTLDNINISLGGDQLVIICGPVGSGKTSLLHALIAELPVSSGECVLKGKVTYATQEPWIFTGNVRQNILFGHVYDEQRYEEIIQVCSLEDDLKQLAHGELTMVGERGVSLSGGQKARINLARALYEESDIYFLDDPLSAVDTRVSRHIFHRCIKNHLKGNLRVLVTHQLQYLPQADHVIVMNDGKILAQGTYRELVSTGIDFVSLMSNETEEDAARRKSSVISLTEKFMQLKEEGVSSTVPIEHEEVMASGSINAQLYWDFFRSGNSLLGFGIIVFGYISNQILFNASEIWLTQWTNEEEQRARQEAGDTNIQSNYLGRNIYIYVYAAITIVIVVWTTGRTLHFFGFCMDISLNIHNRMFASLVRAPVKFFDDNPSGRIMNRFTRDLGAMDELLPGTFFDAVSILLLTIGIMVVIVVANYYMIIPTVILLIIFWLQRKFYIPTARGVKRIESVARSPIFTHVSATIQGLSTIRATQSQQILIHQFDGHQDFHSAAWYIFLASNRWFGIWLEIVIFLFLVIISIGFLMSADTMGGSIGLAISSALALAGQLQWGMLKSAETENSMTSVERTLEYCKVKPEAKLESEKDKTPPKNWPTSGEIEFRNLNLSYESKLVLRNLNFSITGGQKIGIVGRTGAGKSSILVCLFRLTEPTGDIIIDGIRVNDIGLHDLRQNISIIPQDPVLFSGTVRYNLDPFNQFQDSELWDAIEEVDLKDEIPGLDFRVFDGGSNFSLGQRQLVCLARAILRKNHILVMDEATANVDPRTDNLIQRTVRNRFSTCTIITIAHRLHSVMDYDKILVLDAGSLKEYDHPHILLQNPAGALSYMVSHAGKASSHFLHNVAAEAYQSRRALSYDSSKFQALEVAAENDNGFSSSSDSE